MEDKVNMGYKTMLAGSLFLNGEVQLTAPNSSNPFPVPSYEGETIAIQNTIPGAEIAWIMPDVLNIWISKYPLLYNVSWDDLNKYGFVNGVKVEIEGKQYLCRLLQVGTKSNDKNEWDTSLLQTGMDLWDFNHDLFWGKEKICRGGDDFDYQVVDPANRESNVYFRAVLETLLDQETVNGKELLLDGQLFCLGLPSGGKDPLNTKGSDWDEAFATGAELTGNINSLCCESSIQEKTLINGKFIKTTTAVIRRVKGIHQETWGTIPTTIRYGLAFRPLLAPVYKRETGELCLNPEVFRSIPNGTIVYMYSLKMDRKPVLMTGEQPAIYESEARITFTDQFYGEEFLIPWVIFNGKAMAAKNVLQLICWNDLHDQGYVI